MRRENRLKNPLEKSPLEEGGLGVGGHPITNVYSMQNNNPIWGVCQAFVTHWNTMENGHYMQHVALQRGERPKCHSPHSYAVPSTGGFLGYKL